MPLNFHLSFELNNVYISNSKQNLIFIYRLTESIKKSALLARSMAFEQPKKPSLRYFEAFSVIRLFEMVDILLFFSAIL